MWVGVGWVGVMGLVFSKFKDRFSQIIQQWDQFHQIIIKAESLIKIGHDLANKA